MEKSIKLTEYFEDVETVKEHNGYFYSVGEALTVVIPGSLCGLRNISQISQWAANERVKSFLAERFRMERIPCYYWLLCLLKLVESMHWLLDVHFGEDCCCVEDENVQQVLNAVRKIAVNCVKAYKAKSNSRLPLSKIMFGCLLYCEKLIPVFLSAEN